MKYANKLAYFCRNICVYQIFVVLLSAETKSKSIMDDYHAENATSTCQKIFGAALFDGPHGRPKNS
jgi:hypothetical protein